MWIKLLRSPLLYLFLILGTALSVFLGILSGQKILLPLLNVAVAYPVLYTLIAIEERKRAIAAMLYWAFFLGFFTVWAVTLFPAQAEASIFHGASYRDEMFRWIRTGEGAEGNPLLFVPQHMLHFIIFCALSIVSASCISLIMGAVLMNYMSFYVGSLILNSSDTVRAALMGWHPWSIVRVISFVILGVLLGEPFICKLAKRDYSYEGARFFLWAALTGLAIDIVVKTFLAPPWGLMLREILK